MTEKLVESMKLVNFSNIKLPLIVVYDHPSDYPDAYVARVWRRIEISRLMLLSKRIHCRR